MKKILAVAVLCCALFAGVGMAAGEPYSLVNYSSAVFLVDGKPAYDNAYFRQVEFWFDENRAQTAEDASTTGILTIRNGVYYYLDENSSKISVNGEDKTFDLRFASGSDSYVEFAPKNSKAQTIYFRGAAEDGLKNKVFLWKLTTDETVPYLEETVPNFRTVAQQLNSYVPCIEIGSNRISFRMVESSRPAQAVSVPVRGSYRLHFYDIDDTLLFRTDWLNYEANRQVDVGNVSIPDGAQVSDIFYARVYALLYENPDLPDLSHRYVWNFWGALVTDEGVADTSGLKPVTLEVGEQTAIRVRLKSDFGGYGSNALVQNPIFLTDKSIVRIDRTFDSATNSYTLTLKALKKGTTQLSVLYYRNADGTDHRTLPVTVTVTDAGSTPEEEGGNDSGGGGCNVGFAGIAVAVLGAYLSRKR